MTSLDEASALVWPCEHNRNAPSSNSSALLNDLAHSVSSAVWGLMERSKRPRQQQEPGEAIDERPSIQEPWVDNLLQPEQGYTQALKRSDFTVDEGGIFPRDHLFRVLLEQGLIQDALVLFKEPPPAPEANGGCDAGTAEQDAPPDVRQQRVLDCRVVSVTLLGHGVCGHPGIMHGGMTAALIDETCGYLLYLIRHRGLLDFAAVVTASLEVQYKQPLVPDHPVAVTAWVLETAGRKIWVDVVVSDAAYTVPPRTETSIQGSGPAASVPAANGAAAAVAGGCCGNNSSSANNSSQAAGCGKVYATGKALFIIPRPKGSSSALLEQRAEGRDTLGKGWLPTSSQRDEDGGLDNRGYEGNPADV